MQGSGGGGERWEEEERKESGGGWGGERLGLMGEPTVVVLCKGGAAASVKSVGLDVATVDDVPYS